MKFGLDAMLQAPELMSSQPHPSLLPVLITPGDVVLFAASCSACLLDQLVPFNPLTQTPHPVDWIVPPEDISPQESVILSSTPEHFVDDVSEMLLFIAKYAPPSLSSSELQ
jgi:hypothetical protein